MPKTEVVFFAEEDGTAPLLEWLDRQEHKVQDKCLVKIERLGELGYELRRPEADYLRDEIYELRVRHKGVIQWSRKARRTQRRFSATDT